MREGGRDDVVPSPFILRPSVPQRLTSEFVALLALPYAPLLPGSRRHPCRSELGHHFAPEFLRRRVLELALGDRLEEFLLEIEVGEASAARLEVRADRGHPV